MLTIHHTLEFAATHRQDLPLWHPCARLHSHDWIITLELTGPKDAIAGKPATRFHLAAAELSRSNGPLRMQHLNDLEPEPVPSADEEYLAGWVHRWVVEHLAADLAQYLTVSVETRDDARNIRAVQHGATPVSTGPK